VVPAGEAGAGPKAGNNSTYIGAPASRLGFCRRIKIRRGIADASRWLMPRKILMGNRPQRRRNARIRATFETLFFAGRQEGAGVLAAIVSVPVGRERRDGS
jgi:hypothetical protein